MRMAEQPSHHGAAQGGVRALLRLEGLAVLLAAVGLYAAGGHGWLLFLLLFLAPDLSFAGYLAGPRLGAAAYNSAHSYLGPLALGAGSLLQPELAPFALIWGAHVGFDRALGYGLKYASSFHDTHLGRVGRARAA
jgi:hypothetical protein